MSYMNYPEIGAAGPTPEFVRWSIDFTCPIRAPIDSQSPHRVERYLWSLAAIGRPRACGDVIDGYAIEADLSTGNPMRGCRIHDVASFYGGLDHCDQNCGSCAANIVETSDSEVTTEFPPLAGCFGWLVRDERMSEALDALIAADEDRFNSLSCFGKTQPAWYGLWLPDKLEGESLEFVAAMFDQLLKCEAIPSDWCRFQRALAQCRNHHRSLSVELVPVGRVENGDWWTGPYCSHCQAPQGGESHRCVHCGRTGGCHPPIRRKVMGRRPFVELESLMGEENARRIRDRWKNRHNELRMTMPKAEPPQ